MTQYQSDHSKVIKVNDGFMTKGIYNLLISIRDVQLFSKGIKPHRHWRLKDVKMYFGLTGNTQKVLHGLMSLKAKFEAAKQNIEL